MQKLIILFLVFLNISCYAQKEIQFEYSILENQFISYEPVQKSNVSDKDFNKGVFIMKEAKKALRNNLENPSYVDYFNMMSTFLSLKESKANTMLVFEKFKNSEGSCEFLLSCEKQIGNISKYDIIREAINNELSKCRSLIVEESEFNIQEYCKTNSLDFTLVKKIYQLNYKDQKYRGKKSNKSLMARKELDINNQTIIDSLYSIHRTYIGKSLVGKKFESVMWAVIQHSNPEMMERYLPVVHEAVNGKELNPVPLKMLIDRFYGLKYGYQVFGSQIGFGFKLADEETRKEIEVKYDLE